MTDQLISFETAKLAKEKGFNTPSHSYYFEDGEFKEFEINDTYGYYGDEYTVSRDEFYENWNDEFKTTKDGNRCFGCDKNPKYLETYSSPTQSLLQKWLREEYGHHVVVIPTITASWTFKLVRVFSNIDDPGLPIVPEQPPYDGVNAYDYHTYENALEEGLQEALKLIK